MDLNKKLKQGYGLRWEGPKKRCLGHRMIITLAMKIANEEYERYASNNEWYRANPCRKTWILSATPFYTEPARATLAGMLTGPMPDHLKQQIANALIMDNAFRGKRNEKSTAPDIIRP